MTFTELVAEMEKRFPGKSYSVIAEFDQSPNPVRACEHEPKVQRSLTWKVSASGRRQYSTETGSGETPEEALRVLQSKLATPAEPDLAKVDVTTGQF